MSVLFVLVEHRWPWLTRLFHYKGHLFYQKDTIWAVRSFRSKKKHGSFRWRDPRVGPQGGCEPRFRFLLEDPCERRRTPQRLQQPGRSTQLRSSASLGLYCGHCFGNAGKQGCPCFSVVVISIFQATLAMGGGHVPKALLLGQRLGPSYIFALDSNDDQRNYAQA